MMVIMAFIAGRRRHQAQSCVTLKARLKPCTAIRRGHSVGPSTAARPPSWAASVRGSGAVRDPWAEASSPGAWLTRCRQHPHPERHRRQADADLGPRRETGHRHHACGDHQLRLRRRRQPAAAKRTSARPRSTPSAAPNKSSLTPPPARSPAPGSWPCPAAAWLRRWQTPSPTPTPPGSTGSARPTATAASPTARPRSAAMRVLLIEIIGTEIRGPGTFIIVRISARSSDRAAGRLAAGGRPASSSSAWQVRRRC